MGKSNASKVQVPECRYGAACTRKDCVFRHPPKPAKSAPPKKSDKVCFAFVAGRCAFGRQCHDRHPDQESCRTIKDRYNKIDCQWGHQCRTDGCLYRHPSDEPAGPALVQSPPKPQPAVFAAGPKIQPQPQGAEKGAAKPEWSSPDAEERGRRSAWAASPGCPAMAPLEALRSEDTMSHSSTGHRQYMDGPMSRGGDQMHSPARYRPQYPDEMEDLQEQQMHQGHSYPDEDDDEDDGWHRPGVGYPQGAPPPYDPRPRYGPRDPWDPPDSREDTPPRRRPPTELYSADADSSWGGYRPRQEVHHSDPRRHPPPHAPPPPPQVVQQDQDDDDDWARQEQLAATLRCMGFDEEPALHAAQRAGGNLNVAVESALRGSGA